MCVRLTSYRVVIGDELPTERGSQQHCRVTSHGSDTFSFHQPTIIRSCNCHGRRIPSPIPFSHLQLLPTGMMVRPIPSLRKYRPSPLTLQSNGICECVGREKNLIATADNVSNVSSRRFVSNSAVWIDRRPFRN